MDPTQLGVGAVVSVLAVELMHILKVSPWFKYVNMTTEKSNRVLGLVLAAATGLGLQATFNHGTLVVTGLVWSSVLRFALQWAQQQLYYRAIVAQPNTHSQSLTLTIPGKR
jgi:hypothetical protein